MPWVITIEDKKAGEVRLVSEDESIYADDTDYGDVHIVPFYEDGEYLRFGVHEFKRDCVCRPEMKIEPGERPVVVHQERKPN